MFSPAASEPTSSTPRSLTKATRAGSGGGAAAAPTAATSATAMTTSRIMSLSRRERVRFACRQPRAEDPQPVFAEDGVEPIAPVAAAFERGHERRVAGRTVQPLDRRVGLHAGREGASEGRGTPL